VSRSNTLHTKFGGQVKTGNNNKKIQEDFMNFVQMIKSAGIASLMLSRGKVNALNNEVVDQIRNALSSIEHDPDIKAVILTAQGNFFSFGFDIPEFLSYTKQQFTDYLNNFTCLYTYIFNYPKPVVAALNGHTIAGGCMLALACDHRVMVSGKAKISLNEIEFGSSVFAGSTEMLRFHVGSHNAAKILYSGAMYSAEEARETGMVDTVVEDSDLMETAMKIASELGDKDLPAFSSIKSLLRKTVAEEMKRHENDSIKEFVDIWYSDSTWEKLKNIKIH
jgi:3,2-trans-enoyl-CoA isomerase